MFFDDTMGKLLEVIVFLVLICFPPILELRWHSARTPASATERILASARDLSSGVFRTESHKFQ
jgi:hypothetical protein